MNARRIVLWSFIILTAAFLCLLSWAWGLRQYANERRPLGLAFEGLGTGERFREALGTELVAGWQLELEADRGKGLGPEKFPLMHAGEMASPDKLERLLRWTSAVSLATKDGRASDWESVAVMKVVRPGAADQRLEVLFRRNRELNEMAFRWKGGTYLCGPTGTPCATELSVWLAAASSNQPAAELPVK